MTGGQFSSTTPQEAHVGSGFLNQIEMPMDVCQVAVSAGAAYVTRCSSYDKNLAEEIESAIRFAGFSLIDIWGICPGRYTKQNRLTPQIILDTLSKLPSIKGPVIENSRKEYGENYRELSSKLEPISPPAKIEGKLKPPEYGRQEVVILGSAGQRIITAGEILCIAGLSAGLRTTQKNEYDITVLRGPSISELILSPQEIDFTEIDKPNVVIALSQEGIDRRKYLFNHIDKNALIIQSQEVDIPFSKAKTHVVDFKSQHIKSSDRALASLSILAKLNKVIHRDMLQSALEYKFKDKILSNALKLVGKVDIA
jgi:Pyruvate/2-oxoacid:ferredoxin oxidoreductase gamma subunit